MMSRSTQYSGRKGKSQYSKGIHITSVVWDTTHVRKDGQSILLKSNQHCVSPKAQYIKCHNRADQNFKHRMTELQFTPKADHRKHQVVSDVSVSNDKLMTLLGKFKFEFSQTNP